jgi:hypothetical protein
LAADAINSSPPTNAISDAQVKAFMKKWSSGFRLHLDVPTNAAELPLLLAAMEKEPKGRWSYYLIINGDRTHTRAFRLSGEERTNLFARTLTYLRPGQAIIQKALAQAPGDQMLRRENERYAIPIATAVVESGSDRGQSEAELQKLLANNTDPRRDGYGDLIYDANLLLGRMAIRENDIAAAKKHLLLAGKTPGSPTLGSFGPRSYALARELAEKGERDTVIEFLYLVEQFWIGSKKGKDADNTRQALERRRQQLRDGQIPWSAKVR